MDYEIPQPNVFDGESPLHVAVRSGQVEDVRKALDLQLVNVNCLNLKHETPLHLACSLGHTDIVVLLIAFGADPFIKDSDGDIAYSGCGWEIGDLMNKMLCHNNLWINGPDTTNGDTLLHTAVRQGDLANAQRLILKQNISVNDINASYETPLHLACALGHKPIIHFLVTNGADMYKRDCYNNAPIHRAVAKGHVEVVSLLIATFSCDPKVLTGYQGRTLLHFASAVGNTELITTTIEEYEISPLATDAIGQTPLHIAASHGQEEVVSLLIAKYNTPVDCRSGYNLTPLHLACYCGHISCVKRLHKADLSSCDDNGDTPLHKACRGGNLNIVKMLIIEYKADISALNHQKSTPMQQAALRGHKDIVEILINEFQCDPHEKGCDGMSLLHYACIRGHTKLAVMLITKFQLDPCLTDDSGNTPLHIACWGGHEELERLLITKYNCPVDVKDKQNATTLHKVCVDGHSNVVKTLVREYKADLSARDHQKSTPLPTLFDGESPLHIAVRSGQVEDVRKSLDQQVVNVNCLNSKHETPLHLACFLRHKDIVALLIAFGADPFIKDSDGDIAYGRYSWEIGDLMNKMFRHNNLWINGPDKTDGDTLLHSAVRQGDLANAQRLILKQNISVNDINASYETPLHLACALGHKPIVHLLVTNGADMYKRDCYNNAPIHRAVAKGHVEIVNLLIATYSCDPMVLTGYQGRTLLHFASAVGNTELINTTIEEYEISPLASDAIGQTPLHIAASHGQEEVVSLLITKYNSPVDCRSGYNLTPLHLACYCGHISCVKRLHKADLSSCDDNGDTPLHKACRGGNLNIVKMLIIEYKADISALNHQKSTPMQQAALRGHKDIVEILINEFQCNPHEKGYDGMSLLHYACIRGHTKLAVMLITEFELDPCLTDDSGNTPLHIACWHDHEELARLLSGGGHEQLLKTFNSPIFVKNKAGQTALEIAGNSINYHLRSEHKTLQKVYEELRSLSLRKFSGEHKILKFFVLGNPESGKSTLIKSFKKTGISSIFQLSQDAVPPHTAGIVPSCYQSREMGWVMCYDFAGDKEYYSSHSAILSAISKSSVGKSVFVVVTNLIKGSSVLCNEISYWLSFIAMVCNGQSNVEVIVVLSHSDQVDSASLTERMDSVKKYLHDNYVQLKKWNLQVHDIISCNCRRPRSVKSLDKLLQVISKNSTLHVLSTTTTLLNGLLEKDFREVVTCKFQQIVDHVKETGYFLPTAPRALYAIVRELHDIGLLMIIGRSEEPIENHLLLMNIPLLTNDVHKILFSESAKQTLSRTVNPEYTKLGIFPESVISSILPKHIPIDCLIQLQYCQEFTHIEVGLDGSLMPDSASDNRLLYFPALCSSDEDPENWPTTSKLTFSIGWYAKCPNDFDHFPARFLHVLLLKLAFSLALPVVSHSHEPPVAHAYNRRCTMWKNGIRWLMEEGVECIVEIVDNNKGLVAIAKAEESSDEPFAILGKIISVAMQAKKDTCDSVSVQHFLMDSDSPQSFEDKNKLFEINDVERVMKEGKKKVISVSGKNFHDSSHFVILKKFAYWGKIYSHSQSFTMLHYTESDMGRMYIMIISI